MFPRVTHPSAAPCKQGARLACVKPAASVRSEPESNSQVEFLIPARLAFKVLDEIVALPWRTRTELNRR